MFGNPEEWVVRMCVLGCFPPLTGSHLGTELVWVGERRGKGMQVKCSAEPE